MTTTLRGLSPTYLRSVGRGDDADAVELQHGPEGRAEAQRRIGEAARLLEEARKAIEKAAAMLGTVDVAAPMQKRAAALGKRSQELWARISYNWRAREHAVLVDAAALDFLRKTRRAKPKHAATPAAPITEERLDDIARQTAEANRLDELERGEDIAIAVVDGVAPITVDAMIEEIARADLGIETLKTRNSDRLDFHDVSAEGVRRALLHAFKLGASVARQARAGA